MSHAPKRIATQSTKVRSKASVFDLFFSASHRVDVSTTAKLESLLARSLTYEATQNPRGIHIRVTCEYESPWALKKLLHKKFPDIKAIILTKRPIVTMNEGAP